MIILSFRQSGTWDTEPQRWRKLVVSSTHHHHHLILAVLLVCAHHIIMVDGFVWYNVIQTYRVQRTMIRQPMHHIMTTSKNYNSADEDTIITAKVPSRLLTRLSYDGSLPSEIAYPHQYEPHAVAKLAAEDLQSHLKKAGVSEGLRVGKMFGVLVVAAHHAASKNKNESSSSLPSLGYLKAYSGTLKPEESRLLGDAEEYCPPVYNRSKGFYPQEEERLNEMTRQIERLLSDPGRQTELIRLHEHIDKAQEELRSAKQEQKEGKKERKIRRALWAENAKSISAEELEVLEEQLQQESAAQQRRVKQCKENVLRLEHAKALMVAEVDDLKEQRSILSMEVTNRIFEEYRFQNFHGEEASLLDIFSQTPLQVPPGGAGECAAPKLFQAAFQRGDMPIALAEFWWGPSPESEVRKEGFYYPACRGKCEPILKHMLCGLPVQGNPLEESACQDVGLLDELKIVYEDDYLVIVNKPAEVLSVPGRNVSYSVYTEMKRRYPDATGPLLCHRLDLSTSGILVVAKTKEAHKLVSDQFIQRTIKKRYECLLEGSCKQLEAKGKIELPLSGDYIHRPMQKVDHQQGKPAVTYYEILGIEEYASASGEVLCRTRAYLYPVTGRTHQLRVHAAHPKGLNSPLVGDDIYGQKDSRLCLHAGYLQLTHPVTGKEMKFQVDAPF